jgi:hypothetical protein
MLTEDHLREIVLVRWQQYAVLHVSVEDVRQRRWQWSLFLDWRHVTSESCIQK